jgi:hypothetical protein
MVKHALLASAAIAWAIAQTPMAQADSVYAPSNMDGATADCVALAARMNNVGDALVAHQRQFQTGGDGTGWTSVDPEIRRTAFAEADKMKLLMDEALADVRTGVALGCATQAQVQPYLDKLKAKVGIVSAAIAEAKVLDKKYPPEGGEPK